MHLHFFFAAIYPMTCEQILHKLLTIPYNNKTDIVVKTYPVVKTDAVVINMFHIL